MLIGVVWACAVAGDLTSYTLGRRLGRQFLVRHGPRLKITEDRLRYVEGFFDRRGGITILIGRFIGLVRAIAPFLAGASKMQLRKFLPYDVLGSGLWSALFCLLGYFFWRSLSQVQAYIGKGAAAFTGLVVIGLVIWFAVRLRRDEEFRAKVQAYLDGNPVWQRVRGPLMFVADHATLGLELTTLLVARRGRDLPVLRHRRADQPARDAARPGRVRRARDALHRPGGSRSSAWSPTSARSPVTSLAVLVTAIWAIRRHRALEGVGARDRPDPHLHRGPRRQGRLRAAAALEPALQRRRLRLSLRPRRLLGRARRLRRRARPRRPPLVDARRARHRSRSRSPPASAPAASTCARTTSPT